MAGPPVKIIGLSESDAEILRRLVADYNKQRRTDLDRVPFNPNAYQPAADTYFALPPCGNPIPAATSETEPGYMRCCMFRLDWKTDATDLAQMLVPIELNPGEPYKETIFNIYDREASDNLYIEVKRLRSGQWVCVEPRVDSGPSPTTTTPSPLIPSLCAGRCTWEWSASANSWSLTSDGCSEATTTTAAVTTTSAGSTTTSQTTTTCLCPPDSESTTTEDPESTTTTTESPCACLYPTFCGDIDGETTDTFCSRTSNIYQSECPPGTTTTCDCNEFTTTSADPTDCGTGCYWFKSAHAWILVKQDCWDQGANVWDNLGYTNGVYTGCGCPVPADDVYGDTPHCATVHVDCSKNTGSGDTVPTPRAVCSGECQYMWQHDPLGNVPDGWVLDVSTCSNPLGSACDCAPPSDPPEDPNACSFVIVPCVGEDLRTCEDICLTTTSTTSEPTTTTPNCDNHCKWLYSEPVDPCTGNCEWEVDPLSGGPSGFTWRRKTFGCAPLGCFCPDPAEPPSSGSAPNVFTDCDSQSGWSIYDGQCGDTCQCFPPNAAGTNGQTILTPCIIIDPTTTTNTSTTTSTTTTTTTTTAAPTTTTAGTTTSSTTTTTGGPTTTSSTTTTANCAAHDCIFAFDGMVWFISVNGCDLGCNCGEDPPVNGNAFGETTRQPCVPG